MWTPATRRQHSRAGLRYETDLTDAEWAEIAPLMPEPALCGRPATWTTREILNAIFYVLRGGIAWRLIPKDLPPKSTAFGYFSRWRDEGLFGRINHHLVMADRERVGREASPTAVVLDSQSVKTTESGGPRGYDAGVTSPFAQNCTLSGAGQERGGNIPERPQAVGRLSRVPIVLARERDVLPAERRNMGEQFVGDTDALGAEVLDGTVEIGRVPVDDGGRQQAQPRSPEALVLERAVAELALAVEEHGPAERIARLPLVQPGMATLAECRVRQPLQGEQGPFDAPQRP